MCIYGTRPSMTCRCSWFLAKCSVNIWRFCMAPGRHGGHSWRPCRCRRWSDRHALADVENSAGAMAVTNHGVEQKLRRFRRWWAERVELFSLKLCRVYRKIDQQRSCKALNLPRSRTTLTLLEHLQGLAGSLSQVSLQIGTGRKHQIRSNLAHVGHPVVRDALQLGLFRNGGCMLPLS